MGAVTNKKFKPGAVQRNMYYQRMIEENGKLLLAAIVQLHKCGVSRPQIKEMLEQYVHYSVPRWRKNSADGITARKLKEALKQINVTYKAVKEAVIALAPQNNAEDLRVLVENLGIFCLQMNSSLGYGGKRINRVLGMMECYKGNAEEDVQKVVKFDVEAFNNILPDSDDFMTAKTKPPTYSESKRIAAEMEAIRMMQEGITE